MKQSPTSQALAVAVWLVLTTAGFGALSLYAFTGSSPAHAAQRWPTNELLTPDSARPALVLFLHPRCPCSSASITELDRMLSRHPGIFRAYAVVTIPPGVRSGWEKGHNLDAALRLPDVSVVLDQDGVLAREFGATDSGTVLAFAPDGARLFAGGITASRGHEGESLGSLALEDIAVGRAPRQTESPVFGCPMMGPDDDSAGGGGT